MNATTALTGEKLLTQDEQFKLAKQLARKFFRRHVDDLNRYGGTYYCREDVEQEAFAVLLQRGDDPRMALAPFLKATVYNALRDFFLKQLTAAKREHDRAFASEDVPFNPPDTAAFHDPADRAELNEVLAAVDELPHEQQEAIRAWLAGKTDREASRESGCSHVTNVHRRQIAISSLKTYFGVA